MKRKRNRLVNATCDRCQVRFSGRSVRNLLGFLRVECPQCGARVKLPTQASYLLVYWIVMGVILLSCIEGIRRGEYVIPVVLGVIVIIGLARDYWPRKRVARRAGKRSSIS